MATASTMAATASPFQLFPPSVPKIRVATEQPIHSLPVRVESLVKSTGSEHAVISIREDLDTQSTMDGVGELRSRSPSPQVQHETHPASPIDGHKPPHINTALASQPTRNFSTVSRQRVASPAQEASPNSPVVPIRSMFPTYNPSVSLGQQQYFPQRVTDLQRRNMSREEYSPSVSSVTRRDSVLGGPKTAPASVLNFPNDVLTVREPQYSSTRELETLWAATNGQAPATMTGEFDLRMSRTQDAVFTFGSTPALPFYTLETYDTNELSISRTHPRRPTKNIPILLLPLEDSLRRMPPNDGLVTYIFPKLAAMLAIDQSTRLATQHRLAPSERDEMQSDAVARAAAQEACHLLWNEAGQRYDLLHPAVGRDPAKSPHYTMSPTSPASPEQPVLHLTISTHGLTSSATATSDAPVILVTNPNSSIAAQASSPAPVRLSTVPLSDIEESLAWLDFGTMTLHISASKILELAPSLYAVDSVVSAILAVAVSDEATNPIMASMESWNPRPRAPESVFGGSVGGRSYTGSVLFATLAEREEAEQEAKLMRQLHLEDTKGKASKPSFWSKNKTKKQKQKKQILVGEFDMEKYGHYQGGSREGEELPGLVRGSLEAMFMILKFIVWGLTTLVQVLAWVMVSLTRCLTSEKF